jgi:asparagine synthase (glutamine-hydrolysing)
MCGVFASLGAITEEQVGAALSAMAHRGPNGEGRWRSSDGEVTLGHRRLSIIAPENGAQPIVNEDGTVVAVVNGEFYDFQRLRSSLKDRGHIFRTESDSEILIHLYEEHGVECLSRLRGEFAFILWDGKRRELFCARDRFGIKPLVVAVSEDRVLIASEAKALLKAGVPARFDLEALGVALRQQYLPVSRSLFEGIEQLPRACAALFRMRDGRIERTQWAYWNLPQPTLATDVHREAVVERVRELLSDAVRVRMVSDVPVGVYLSGGVDSASVLGLMCRQGARPLGFSVITGDPVYSELDDIQASTSFHGSELEQICVTPYDLLANVSKSVYYAEGLAINGHLPAKYLLSARARERGVPVVLSGEGSDELFLGYPHFMVDAALERGQPTEELTRALEWSNPTARGLMLSGHHTGSGLPHFYQTKRGLGERISEVLHPSYLESFSRAALSLPDSIDSSQQLATARSAWVDLALSNYILRTLGDGTEMANSIEGRTPFLDHLLWEGLADIPLQAWVDPSYGGGKSILRDAVVGLVPDPVRQRAKRPFVTPPLELDRGSAAGRLAWDLCVDQAAPFFSRKALELLLRELADAGVDHRKEFDPVLFTIITANCAWSEFAHEAP